MSDYYTPFLPLMPLWLMILLASGGLLALEQSAVRRRIALTIYLATCILAGVIVFPGLREDAIGTVVHGYLALAAYYLVPVGLIVSIILAVMVLFANLKQYDWYGVVLGCAAFGVGCILVLWTYFLL